MPGLGVESPDPKSQVILPRTRRLPWGNTAVAGGNGYTWSPLEKQGENRGRLLVCACRRPGSTGAEPRVQFPYTMARSMPIWVPVERSSLSARVTMRSVCGPLFSPVTCQ